jgi:UDP-glucose 6-dehydrogenase
MHVQIIGMGVVGKAQAKVMQKLGHRVTGCDVKPGYFTDIPITDTPVEDADLTFLCPPEKVVPDVIENLVKNKVHNPYVIKSTVPPGTTQAAMLKHGVHICHNPEFLREETSIEDALNQEFVVIGECCPKHGDAMVELYKPLGVEIIRTTPNTSEMAKLVLNNHLAALITFWNEVDGTAFFNKPFGGKCLPKDLNQMLDLCHSKGLSLRMLETIKEINGELELLDSFRP